MNQSRSRSSKAWCKGRFAALFRIQIQLFKFKLIIRKYKSNTEDEIQAINSKMFRNLNAKDYMRNRDKPIPILHIITNSRVPHKCGRLGHKLNIMRCHRIISFAMARRSDDSWYNLYTAADGRPLEIVFNTIS